MKIAQIVSTFPPRLGGMGSVCFEEATRLAEHHNAVTVFFTLDYKDSAIPQSAFFSTIRLRSLLRLGDAGAVPQLFWRLRSFDIIHLHYPFYGGAEWAALAAWFWNIPLVVTIHMEAAPTGLIKRCIQTIYDSLLSAWIKRRAARLITVNRNHFVTTQFGRRAPAADIQEIVNGVDTERFFPEPVDWQTFPHSDLVDKKIILFVGNLLACKGLEVLIKAFALTMPTRQDARLLIVGGGYEAGVYRRLVSELNLNEQVIFAGPCFDESRLRQYYNSATCLVVPSDETESFSLVLSEALAAGCPVVVSNTPSLRTRVTPGQDGWLFETGNSPDLSAKLSQALALNEADRERYGKAGRQKMIENFSWETHISALEKVYEGILNGSKLEK